MYGWYGDYILIGTHTSHKAPQLSLALDLLAKSCDDWSVQGFKCSSADFESVAKHWIRQEGKVEGALDK